MNVSLIIRVLPIHISLMTDLGTDQWTILEQEGDIPSLPATAEI